MTIDDDKSIYVGGLRYDCNEDDLRRAFELYGSVVAVKIINDRGSAGKCYAFVTFTNPRSAMNAIHAMNGRTIGGRAVKVNEVRSRGAGPRSNYANEDTFRHNQRNIDFNRGRGRKRDYEEHARGRYHDRYRQRERGYEFAQGDEPTADRFYDREEGFSRGVEHHGRGGSRSYDHESEQDRDHESDHQEHSDRVDDQDKRIEEEKQDLRVDTDSFGRRIRKGKERHSKKRSRSSSPDRRTREISTDSSEDHHRQSEGQLDSLVERREELIKEKSELEQRLREKNQDIVDLRRRSLKLEDALTSAKKVSSLRQAELTKLYKCFLQVKDYGERLKNSEEELQALVESVMMDMDADSKDGYLQNGEV